VAFIVPETYTTRFGGLPGTLVLIERGYEGWTAKDVETLDYVIAMKGGGFFWGSRWGYIETEFDTAQEAADAAESAYRF
jgi:hypothetical protein